MMTVDELGRIKKKIMPQGFPSRGDNVLGMILDFEHALEQSEVISLLSVKKTGEPGQLIRARCKVASAGYTVADVVAEVERIWMEELRYRHFESHAVTWNDEEIVLDFITVIEKGGFYVTGAIVVDIERLQIPAKPIDFSYQLVGRGSSVARISDGSDSVSLYASYLSDALGDLTRAVVALLRGAGRATCSWADEPGEYRWILERQASNLQINILWFEETFSRKPDEAGWLIFSAECKLKRFAVQLRDQLQQLISEHGIEGYEALWAGHEFPKADYGELDRWVTGGSSVGLSAG